MSVIPASVLKLLEQEWKPSDGSSSFERIFYGEDYTDRRSRPSYYGAFVGKENMIDSLRVEEVRALMVDGVLAGLATDRGDSTSINEHAQHAIYDFCEEVYAAWKKCQERLNTIPRK